MTNFEKLIFAPRLVNSLDYTIEVREISTGKEGVASHQYGGMVDVFIGAEDGSDDKTITPEEFNENFVITRIFKD